MLELENSHEAGVVAQRRRVAVDDRDLPGRQLDLGPAREPPAAGGAGEQPVEPFLGVDHIREQAPPDAACIAARTLGGTVAKTPSPRLGMARRTPVSGLGAAARPA
jgi:hypothetical protein